MTCIAKSNENVLQMDPVCALYFAQHAEELFRPFTLIAMSTFNSSLDEDFFLTAFPLLYKLVKFHGFTVFQ